MVCVIVFGHRAFGACDYFSMREDANKLHYVRTIFFHISFIPLCPIKSYIGSSDADCCGNEKVFMVLPDISCKSVGWAWLRILFFLAATACFISITFMHLTAEDSTYPYDGSGVAVWKTITLIAAGVVLFAVGVFLMIFKFHASEDSRQRYLEMIAERIRSMREVVVTTRTGERLTVRRAPQGSVQANSWPVGNVQAQVQGPPQYDADAPPAYDYNQAPIQSYPTPTLPPQAQNQVPMHGYPAPAQGHPAPPTQPQNQVPTQGYPPPPMPTQATQARNQ